MDATILPGPGSGPPARGGRANGDRHSIQSVDRALLLLETIAEAGGETTLTDLANRTGLNISTCHHLLATLIKRGFAAKVPGPQALRARLAHPLRSATPACKSICRGGRSAIMENINQATGETVHLATFQGDTMVVLAVRDARHAVRVDTGKIGKHDAPHATSLRQGDAGLAARGRDAAHLLPRHEALHRQHHHRISRVH